jgi:beta-lactamase superfamily II metal-dependent hydrolase
MCKRKWSLAFAAICFLAVGLMACQPAPTPTPVPTATPSPVPSSPSEVSAWNPGQFEIVLMDVKHGDAQLIISPTGETLLIDAGEEAAAPIVAEKVRAVLGKLEVDYFLATHYHEDHIGGFVPLLRDHGLVIRKAILDRGGGRTAYTSALYRRYYDYIENPSRGIKHVRLAVGNKIDLGASIQVEVMAVGDSEAHTNCGIPVNGGNDNDYSIALWVTFGKFDYWTSGDLSGEDSTETTDAESACARLVTRPVDLYKADHHAISWNNSANLLKALQPQVAMISLDNLGKTDALPRMTKYAHLYATNKILALDSDRKTPIIVNDGDDLIVLSRDGNTFTVEGEQYSAR